MHRSKLKNIFNKTKTVHAKEQYKRQRNFCVNLLRKNKKTYFRNLEVKDLKDNRKFWKTIKPFFSNKGSSGNKLLLKENNRLISDESELSVIMNEFFVNITKGLELKDDRENNLNLSLESILEKFEFHQSVEKISQKYESNEMFKFHHVDENTVKDVLSTLDCSKAVPYGDIPVNILKATIDVHVTYLTKVINQCFDNNFFPNILKLAEVCPIFKKNDYLDKENYRHISV